MISFKDSNSMVMSEIYVGLLYILINSPKFVVVTFYTIKTQDLCESMSAVYA